MTLLPLVLFLSLWCLPAWADSPFNTPPIYLGKGEVRSALFSPDSQVLVVVHAGGMDLYDARSLDRVAALNGQDLSLASDATPAVLSPDGHLLAVINRDSTIGVWDLAERRLVATLTDHKDRVTALAFSRDGQRLASGAADGAILLWEVGSWHPLGTMRAENVRVLAFSPDGRRLASGNGFRAVRLWDLATLQQVALFRHEDNVTHLGFDPEGSLLASGSRDGTVRLWDMQSLAENERVLFRGEGAVGALAFSPDGSQVAFQTASSFSGRVYLGQVQRGTSQVLAREAGEDLLVGFTPDSQTLLTLNTAWGALYRWRTPSATLADSLVLGSLAMRPVGTLAPDGRQIVVRMADQQLGVWDLDANRAQGKLTGFAEPIRQVAFSPDGRWAATLGEGWISEIRLWSLGDFQQGAVLRSREGLTRIAFAADGSRLLVGTFKSVWSWDLRFLGEKEVGPDLPLPEGVRPLVLAKDLIELPLVQGLLRRRGSQNVHNLTSWTQSADGRTLALALQGGYIPQTENYAPGGVVLLWDELAGVPLSLLEGHRDDIYGMAFSPDGTRLATVAASVDSFVRVWDVGTAQQVLSLPTSRYGGFSLAFSPDGQYLAQGGVVAFSPGGDLLAASSGQTWLWSLKDGVLANAFDAGLSATLLMDLADGATLTPLEVPSGYTSALAFSPDGALLAEGKAGGLVLRRRVEMTAVESTNTPGQPTPTTTRLWPSFPNPFNRETVIHYDLAQPGPVRLEVYNLTGQRIAALANQVQEAGRYGVIWGARDDAGRAVSSGVYLLRLEVASGRQTRRLMLLK
ncbi:MAG: T9SS type A sorting domain-containing protein [Candidatus Latescibacteria bacterium]|nr:T9SS type A sorting domain-containing protein [Candidatus Latescibacterota bacterium]